MEIELFKFGGASVNSSGGVRNIAKILTGYCSGPVVVILSAMGKTTNALEEVLRHYRNNDPLLMIESFETVRQDHFRILMELIPEEDHPAHGALESLFDQLRGYLRKGHLYTENKPSYDFEYDQVVSYGELFSTLIVHHYLHRCNLRCELLDARELIKTDDTYRDARIDWTNTESRILRTVEDHFTSEPGRGSVVLTQGFIGSDGVGNTTTLGREGSDFSAAIFAYSLKAKEMTIWKDVPGVMNADPKWIPDASTLPALSYREAIELAYYGASVIHPKTIKPLENAGITLKVKSFLHPDLEGTVISDLNEWTIRVPVMIRKQNQVLISISARDFSFIVEENLSEIFRILAEFRIRVNVMQNSAISFSVCVDDDPVKLPPLLERLKQQYSTRYNAGVELFTIRHYRNETVDSLIGDRNLLLEQKSRNTLQVVVQ